MKYLLETTTCSRLMVNDPKVDARLTSAQVNDDVFTCFIVKGEIRYGVERLPIGKRRTEIEQKANRLFSLLPCEPIPEEAGDYYGQLKYQAEQQGTPLGENDLWIAATALALDAVLVTSDSDFQRIVGLGLQLENWTK